MRKNRIVIMALTAVLLGGFVPAGCGGKETGKEETMEETRRESKEKKKEEKEETEESGDTAEPSSEAPKEQREIQAPHMTKEEYPVVDGSTATIPLSTALYQLVTGASAQEAEKAVDHSKTTMSYMRLIYGEADLVIAYEPAKTVYDAIRDTGQDVIISPIGKDALVFMANEGNPVTSLTTEQLTEIYRGTYKDWSQVGGSAKEIIAFQRPSGSGSQTLMEKLVMKGLPMADAPWSRVVGEMGELIEEVASYNNEENALGYSVYFYARNMYQKPGLRFMAVDGVMPDNDTIKEGSYPFVNEFYAAIREDEPEDSPAYQLFQWLTTEDGQALVESVGYVGMGETKNIHVEADPLEAVEPGTITLKESDGLVLDGDFADGRSGIMVLGADLSEKQFLTDKRTGSTLVCFDDKDVIPLIDSATENTGLYNVTEGRWEVEPVYGYLTLEKDGTYYGYRDNGPCRVQRNPATGAYEEYPGMYQRVGDCWWKEDGDRYEIYPGEKLPAPEAAPEKTLDFSQTLYSYGYTDQNCYAIAYKDGSREIYDCRGNLIFGEALLGRPVSYQNFQSGLVWGVEPGFTGDTYMYNTKKQEVVSRDGDQIDSISMGGSQGYFCVIRDGEKLICQEDGEAVLSSTGKTFDRLVGEDFLGRWENGILEIERPLTKERYEISCGENFTANVIRGNVFRIYDSTWNDSQEAYYQGSKCLMEDEYLYWTEYEEFVVLCGKDRQIVTDNQGNIIYETDGAEFVLGAYPELLLLRRGNYLCITDHKGVCGFRTLIGYMTDD